ncbi:hypothetical protein ACJW30_05G121100 [Castanea mollissima]
MRAGAQQSRGNTVARWGNVRANDLNVHPVLYKCSTCQKRFDNLRVICSHLIKHNCHPYKGLTTPSNVVCLEHLEDEDREICVDGQNCHFQVTILQICLFI